MKKNISICSICMVSLPLAATLVSCNNKPTSTITFENDTWANIVEQANKGLDSLKEYYKVDSFVGLERHVNVWDIDYTIRVIGENEDSVAKDGQKTNQKAALTLQFANVVSYRDEENEIQPLFLHMCDEDTASKPDRWANSLVRLFLNEKIGTDEESINFKKDLETALGGAGCIKPVWKNSFNLNEPEKHVTGSAEYLFLPAIADIFAGEQLPYSSNWDYSYEGNVDEDGKNHPYSYYQSIIPKDVYYDDEIKSLILRDPNGYQCSYWLRTPEENDIFDFTNIHNQWLVSLIGTVTNINPIEDEYYGATMAPIFCL